MTVVILPPHDQYALCDPAVRLCCDCLRIWLDRPPPRPDEREWEEFELERVEVAAA